MGVCAGTDGGLYCDFDGLLGSPWGGWQYLGGPVTSGPDVVTQQGTVYPNVVARGNDGGIWHYGLDQASGNWVVTPVGGQSLSAPAICSWATGRLDVFTIGTDKALYHCVGDGTGKVWSAWEALGGALTSGPAAACMAANRIDVVARGLGNPVWHIAWNGSTFTEWTSRGGITEYRPTIVASGPGKLDVFVTGADLALWQISGDGTNWGPWTSRGGVLTSAPAAASPVANRIDVIARQG